MEHFDFRRELIRSPLQPVFVGCADKRFEQGMRLQRLRLKLGVELASDEMGMIWQFDHFHICAIWS
jgi:hypothetical protein